MTTLSFIKAHAAAHDFVIFSDADAQVHLTEQQIREICDRNRGVGAAGVIRAVRSSNVAEGKAILEEEPDAEWFMDCWRADGTRVDADANAVRVLAHYLIDEGLISPERRDTIPIGTRAGVRDVLAGVSGYTVDLGRWRLGDEHLVNAGGLRVSRPGLVIELGGPHVVTVLSDESTLEQLDLQQTPEVAPIIEQESTTVFVVPEDPFMRNGVARIRIRVYEEASGEALSSGSAAAAAALAFRHWGGDQMPNSWSIETAGGRLSVRMFPTEEGEHVSLSGPVEIAFRGEVTIS